MFSKKK